MQGRARWGEVEEQKAKPPALGHLARTLPQLGRGPGPTWDPRGGEVGGGRGSGTHCGSPWSAGGLGSQRPAGPGPAAAGPGARSPTPSSPGSSLDVGSQTGRCTWGRRDVARLRVRVRRAGSCRRCRRSACVRGMCTYACALESVCAHTCATGRVSVWVRGCACVYTQVQAVCWPGWAGSEPRSQGRPGSAQICSPGPIPSLLCSEH